MRTRIELPGRPFKHVAPQNCDREAYRSTTRVDPLLSPKVLILLAGTSVLKHLNSVGLLMSVRVFFSPSIVLEFHVTDIWEAILIYRDRNLLFPM